MIKYLRDHLDRSTLNLSKKSGSTNDDTCTSTSTSTSSSVSSGFSRPVSGVQTRQKLSSLSSKSTVCSSSVKMPRPKRYRPRRAKSERVSTVMQQDTNKSSKTSSSLPKNPENPKEKKGILRSLSFQFTPFYGTRRRRAGNAVHTYDSTPAADAAGSNLGPIKGVQCHGQLMKKCNKFARTQWNKRFFVLKECFLLYYSAKYKKRFDKNSKINMHPKGIVPLIGCSIVPGGDIGKGKKYCLLITHPQFKSAVIIAAPDAVQQEKWLKALREATKISFKNTVVGESLIRELESKGIQLNVEKKDFEDRLQKELDARQKEEEKNEQLEKVKKELEKEREKLVKITKKLKDDLHNVKNDLKLTNEGKKTLEQEKMSLMSKTQHLVSNLESLNMEKSKIEDQMSSIIREREKFLLENQNLSSATCQLKNRLMEIESKTTCLVTEKEKVEDLLRSNKKKTEELEKERQYYNSQTNELLSTMKDISQQKEMTEAELRDEMMARLGAERQLQAAEKALEHLENALRLTGAQMTELQEHILPDVHKLREFFEKCADEARLEADKGSIMKNAVYARRSFRRAKNRCRASFRRHTSMKQMSKPSQYENCLDDNANEIDDTIEV